MIHYDEFDSPLGRMLATAEDGALTGLYFAAQKYHPASTDGWVHDTDAAPLPAVRRQLREYFAGTRRAFDFPVAPGGGRATAFQKSVWQAIAAVPFGATTTYGALAAQCGRPAAARAAGAATGRNPISLVIPCHRIVGGTGALTGYAGGLSRKEALLGFERDVAHGHARPLAAAAAADLFGAPPPATARTMAPPR